MASILIENISVLFGHNHNEALELADAGYSRSTIKNQCDCIIAAYNCSLNIKHGESLVIAGSSGAGKSTLVRAMSGLTKSSRGHILIGNSKNQIDVVEATKDELTFLQTRFITNVFQYFAIQPQLSVAETLGADLDINLLTKQQREKIIADRLNIVSLTEFANKKMKNLAFNMQNYIWLVRGFLARAPILFMDEPFSTLDPALRGQLQNELIKLQQRFSKTLVYVTSNIQEAIKIGHNIAIMQQGRLVQFGTPQDIIQKPINDYVANFFRPINTFQYLTARDIMQKLTRINADMAVSAMVKPETSLFDLITALNKKRGAIGVIENSKIIGVIAVDDIIQLIEVYKKLNG